jgi:hypothetical protein
VKDPVGGGLAALFTILGAIAAYYLVRGLRDGRIGMRLRFPYRTEPLSDGREPGYAYRSHSPSLFWTEIGMQVMAVAVSVLMIFVLLMAP